ncbi:MAG: gliding motility-associated C-terminal domain-containing protein [Saprospiraceae bacterium]
MLKRLFPITLLTFMATVAFAQNPRPIQVEKVISDPNQESILACPPGMQNFAGTVSLGTFTGSSNDINLNTMYLCLGDQVEIIHNGDFDLSGDPAPATTPGIGYAFYDCAPTVDGPDLITITTTDACLYQNPTFGNPPVANIGPNNIWVATSTVNMQDLDIENTGALQDGFNNGNPVQFWFSPITLDEFATQGYENSGSCVNSNVNAAFSVVYLNEITATNQQTSGTFGAGSDLSNCIGTFELNGGLPEFDSNESYNISITLNGNPSVTGSLISVINGLAKFQIFEPGLYDISITDGKACPANFQMDMSGCTALGTNIADVTALPATTVCVPFFAQDFTDIFSFQYTIHWDPTILSFANANFVNPDLNNLDLNFNTVGADGLATSFFYDFGSGATLTIPDGDPLFEICFNVLGPVGSMSPITIDGDPTIIDVYNGNNVYLGFVSNTGSVTIVNQAIFDITITPNDVSCNGLSDGSIDFTVNVPSNGTAPYNIGYSEVGNPTNNGSITGVNDGEMVTQPGLPAGTYALTIADSSVPPVVDLDTIVIDEPPILGASISVSQPILCFGDTNGSFTADVIVGGVIVSNPGPEYTFLWTPGNIATQTISNVNPALGTYAVTITDGNMCTAVASTTPSQPSELTVGVMVTDAACSGIDNGEIEATGMGGVVAGDYTYAWSSTPTQTTQIATNLGIGTYTVTITDDNMCTATATGTVSAATIIFANSVVSDVQCNGADDGAIFHAPSVIGVNNGGYTYQWSPNVSNISSASPLAPGTYTTTITDALGCNIDTTITIAEPDALVIDGIVNTTDETCAVGGNDGTASVNIIGGSPFPDGSYTYTWTCCAGVDANSVNNVPQGNYIVTIEDANNCSVAAPFTINPPTPPMIVSFDSIPVPCPSSTTGELTVNAVEGNTPITGYAWTFPNGTNANGQTISNLGPGTYTVTVTAADGCVAIDSATLFAPEQLLLVQTLPTDPSCFGLADGTATVQMSGGTMPYAYQWSTNAGSSTNSAVPNLPSGTYTVTITDDNLCDQVVTEVVLEDPAEIDIVFTDSDGVSCFGQTIDCDGTASAIASGGGAGSNVYTYSWSSGEIEADVSSTAVQLCQGIQYVTVSDGNNCFAIDSIIISAPPPLGINPTLNEPTCFGESDGSITANGTGGNPAYTFEWENGTTDITLANIPAGDYPVTVTDMNGCEFDTIVMLGEPELLVAFIDSTENITCSGDADGFIQVDFTGGNGDPMTYSWSGGLTSTTNTVSSLAPGTYTVTVEDVNGCSAEVSQVITEPIPVFGFIPTPEEPICNGDQTLLTVETAGGGVGGPYTFSIDGGPAQNIGTAISVFAGDHVVEISDGNGCTYTEDIFINQPPPIIVNLGPDVEIQLGESIQLNAILSGSNVPIDSIIWTPMIFDSTSCMNCLNPTVSPLDDQVYTVEIFDINGCNGSDDILVEVDKNRNVYIPNVFTPNGDGYNDEFQVFSGPGVTQINSMQIFDRWGEVVFERNNLSPSAFPDVANGWDGRFRGKIMNPGVFIYLIEVTFDDGITLLYRGDLTLLH